MALQLLLPLSEIRRKLAAKIGWSNSATAQVQVTDQLNELIAEANDDVLLERKWVTLKTSKRQTIGQDQQLIAFPDNCGPENVLVVAVWDTPSSTYIPLRRKIIKVLHDDDPLSDPAGTPPLDLGDPTVEASHRAMPVWWEPVAATGGSPQPVGQIKVWPKADQQYDLKIEYMLSGALKADNDISVVDARLIIDRAAQMHFELDGDVVAAAAHEKRYRQRLAKLASLQQSGELIAIDSTATFEDTLNTELGIPRYDFSTGRAPGV